MLVDPFPIPEDWWRGAGLDFGYNNAFATVWLARNGDGVYYLTDEYKKTQTLLEPHATKLKNQRADVWYGDPAAAGERAELRRLGIPVQEAVNDVVPGLDTLNQLMASGRFKVFKGMSHWIDEIEGYVWSTKADEFTDKPVKLNDHLMDATRYLVHTVEKSMGPTLFT